MAQAQLDAFKLNGTTSTNVSTIIFSSLVYAICIIFYEHEECLIIRATIFYFLFSMKEALKHSSRILRKVILATFSAEDLFVRYRV